MTLARLRLGLLFAALYVACGILVYAVPGFSTAFFTLLTHSTVEFSVRPFNALEFVLGIVAWFAIGIIVSLLHKKICECCK